MKLCDLIADRRTVHDYTPEPLPEGLLERAVAAALSAPNHRMTEPWRFVRVGVEHRTRLLEISCDLKRGDGPPLAAAAEQKLRDKLLTPAELLVVCQVQAENPDVAREDYAAIACAVQNLMLCLWEAGVGSKWSTGKITTDPRTYQLLGVDPAAEHIVAFLWAGHALRQDAPKPRRRRSASDVLRELP